ncbi:MAG: site-2 protease family protein [Anaerolineaceae bacterium]|nr:site-2 protease family protein [Anaerolineaceae bacterium]
MESSYAQQQVQSPYFQQEVVDSIIRRVFSIEDITQGTTQQNFIYRYRGHILGQDTAAVYDQLASQLKPYNLTPLFRWDGDRHSIELIKGLPVPRASNSRVNLLLGILTILSVIFTGAVYSMQTALPSNPLQALLAILQNGWPFALSISAILGAHEFGHYIAGRLHGVHLSLPYFIPLPIISPFGTMGAVINMKEPPRNRRVLLDIGVAGPLAGFIVAVPVLLYGLSTSTVSKLPIMINSGSGFNMEGSSVIYLLAKLVVFGRLLPAPVTTLGMSSVMYWLSYFFTGHPFPFGGLDVNLNSVAWAGWAGLLVTAMNLVPAGQLDGGHMLYVLVGRKIATKVRPVVLVTLVLLGFVWNGWWLWAVLIFFLGRYYAEPLDQITPLDNRRKIFAILALILFLLTFTPVPLQII